MKFLPHSLALLPGSTRIGLGKVPVKSAERYIEAPNGFAAVFCRFLMTQALMSCEFRVFKVARYRN